MSVRLAVDGGVLVVTLDRPKANAIDVPTSQELFAAFERLHRDDALRVAVLTGAGDRFFSAGWDLKAAASGEPIDADHGPGGFGGLTEFTGLRKPVIAAVNGLALGGGFELALAADLIVASEHAVFALPEGDSGPGRRLGRCSAPSETTAGCRGGGDTAHRPANARAGGPPLGPGEPSGPRTPLDRRGDGTCPRHLRERATGRRGGHRDHRGDPAGLSLDEAYRRLRGGDLPNYRALLGAADAREGPQAFAEKRPPRWTGR